MSWLTWFIPTLYFTVSFVGWVIIGRQEYREYVANDSFKTWITEWGMNRYTRTEEQRLDKCRKEAMKAGAAAFWWPLALIAAPFYGAYLGIRYLVTSDVDKELEKKKQLEKAQKIVDEYNAKKKAEEERVWAEVEGKEPPRDSRPLKCRHCGLPHRSYDCDMLDEEDEDD